MSFVFTVIEIILIVFIGYVIYSRSKFKNRKSAGAFFFENDCLVLNTGLPYSIPFNEIDYVELQCKSWELEHKWSYNLGVKVVKKNGKKKWIYYKGYRTAKLALPSDMKTALEEKGIRCVMVDK